jgi:vacuolar-type H+-ATPase subunit I/STV1
MATLREILGDAYKADMTLAEIESALNGKNLADLSGGQYVSVGKYNSAISERDDYKAKYTDTLTEAQKAEQANIERENRYKEIEKQNSIYRYTEKFSSTIKDKTILTEVATLMADGKFEEAIDKQNDYLATENAEMEKRIKDELMKQNPQAQAGNDGAGTITKEQFDKMTVAERTKLYKEQPEKYNEFVNQN